jgi:hypothetical protein
VVAAGRTLWELADRAPLIELVRKGAPELSQDQVDANVSGAIMVLEASSDAFVDNHGSNAISRGLGYEPNGSEWATRQGKPALLNRWRLTRDDWEQRRRDDIQLHNIEACHALLPLS